MEDTLKIFNHTLLIKQVPICTLNNNKAVVNVTGNPGLATAGTGTYGKSIMELRNYLVGPFTQL